MSAESNMLSPASRQTSTRRVASVTSVEPHALNTSPRPPNVPVPKQSAGTLKPDFPSCRNSMVHASSSRDRFRSVDRIAIHFANLGEVLQDLVYSASG